MSRTTTHEDGYVLIETLATEKQGRPILFRQMTGIGPMTTANPDEAARFASEQEAKGSPAYTFWLTFFEPVPFREAQS